MGADPRVTFHGNASSVERAAAASATAINRVDQSAGRAGRSMHTTSKHAGELGVKLRDIAKISIGTLGAEELVKGIKESINAAGDLEKQQAKVHRVFGETPKVLERFEKTAAKAYGVSHLGALRAAASTGALLKNLGIGGQVAAGMSVGILKLSSDMASFNNLPTATVADRVNKALLGQTRGLKSLGISLSATDVNAKALAIGLVRPLKSADGLRAATDRVTVAGQKWIDQVAKHGKASTQALSAEASLIKARQAQKKAIEGVVPPLTAAQRAQATYALILERSKVQQGDFSRNSDTLANKTKVLDAEFSNLTDRIGEALVPAMKVLVDFMSGPGIAGANKFLSAVGTQGKELWHGLQPLAPVAHAAAAGLQALAGVQGVVPSIVATAAAYKGLTIALEAGASAKAAAAGFISALTNPFARAAEGAKVAATEARAAGIAMTVFGAEAVAADAEMAAANKVAGASFLGLANPIAAIATVGAIAVGALVYLGSTTESTGDKARKARDDFLGLVDALDKVKSTKLDVTQAKLDVARDRLAIKKFSPTLVAATAAAHQSFPDTAKGDRAEAAAKQHLSDVIVQNSQKYVDLARDKARLTQATTAATKADADGKKASTDAASAYDGLRKALEGSANMQNIMASRSGHPEKTLGAQQRAAQGVIAELGKLTDKTAGLSSAQRTNVGLIQAFIRETGKVPDKKTFKLLLDDAATSKVKDFKLLLDGLTGKTVDLTVRQINSQVAHPFRQTNPLTGKPLAAGGVIDRPQIAIVGEEAPAHPEFVIPTNPARRGRALDLIDQMRGWIPGFAGGAGPPGSKLSTSAYEKRLQQTTSPSSSSSKSGKHSAAKAKKPEKPKWLQALEADGLPHEKAYQTALAHLQSDYDDAQRTPAKSDDIRAIKRLRKLSRGRLGALRGLRGQHTDSGAWQTAVSTGISSIDGQLGTYQASLSDLVKVLSPDDVQVPIPSSIKWGIEQAGFSDGLGDDVKAQTKKATWLKARLAETVGKGRNKKFKLTGAKRLAYQHELDRTRAELASLGVSISDQKTADDDKKQADKDQALADAGVPPDLPLDVQEALANAALTPDKADDLAALQLEQATLEGQLAAATDQRVRIALKGSLAGVTDEIANLTGAAATLSDGSVTPQQQAINDQLQARLDNATRSAALSEAEVKAFGSSGDIGTGGYGNALSAAPGTPAVLTVLGDQRSLSTLAGAFVAGASSQPAISASREWGGI